jgi:transposase
MDSMIWVISIGLVIVAFIIRFIERKLINKAGDAIQNKLVDRHNEKSSNKEENLMDRYK